MRFAVTLAFVLTAAAALAHPPVSVVFDSRGNAYYSDLNHVWRLTPAGAKSVAVPNVHTHELYMDANDNLFGEHLWYEGERTDKWGWYVWKRDARGKVSRVIPRTAGFPTNYSFVRDRVGNMYFAAQDRKSLVKRTPQGKNAILARGFHEIRWMNATAGGTVFLVDNGAVVRVTQDGKVTHLARGLAKSTLLRPHVADRHALQGIWLDKEGNVYVADSAHAKVLRVTPAGKVSVVAESILPWSPSGGAIAGNGETWLLEYSPTNAVRVRRVRTRR